MAEKSFQHEKPPARINIFLDQKAASGMKTDKLDFRMLVTGQFSGKESEEALEDVDVIENINRNNFHEIMKGRNLSLEFPVENKINDDGDLAIKLNIDNLESFSPDSVAAQVPALARLLAARKLMGDLKNRLLTVPKFRKQLEEVLKDDAKLNALLEELKSALPPDEENTNN